MDVFLVMIFYYDDIDKIIGVFTSFDGARTAMLINDPSLTQFVRHEIVSHEAEIWTWTSGPDIGVIHRLPLSGGAS